MKMIEIKNVSKSFGVVKAVADLSLKVGKGQIVGFLGPNGAGKTTTMRMITGFLFPDQGEIFVAGGNVVENEIEICRHIGYLPENAPLYKHMIVSDFLRLTADLKGIAAAKKKESIDYAVASTGIASVYNRVIGELSRGFKQRVGLAQALLHQPEILILDEPTEGLDPNQRAEIRDLIKEIGREKTILISTHVMQEVTAVCNRILIINEGCLVADGTTEELLRKTSLQNSLLLEVGDQHAVEKIRLLEGVVDAREVSRKQERVSMRITFKSGVELQPAIAKLARENNWIIWKLAEEQRTLEEIFKHLTTGRTGV